jgi:rhodanese-related sulfurtransferase
MDGGRGLSLNLSSASSTTSLLLDFGTILTRRDDYLIVDVRDTEDFSGGHIRGCLHQPYSSLDVSAFARDLTDGLARRERAVVFCCMFGKMRSVDAALQLQQLVRKTHSVHVLSGGFQAVVRQEDWRQRHVEDFDEGMWKWKDGVIIHQADWDLLRKH